MVCDNSNMIFVSKMVCDNSNMIFVSKMVCDKSNMIYITLDIFFIVRVVVMNTDRFLLLMTFQWKVWLAFSFLWMSFAFVVEEVVIKTDKFQCWWLFRKSLFTVAVFVFWPKMWKLSVFNPAFLISILFWGTPLWIVTWIRSLCLPVCVINTLYLVCLTMSLKTCWWGPRLRLWGRRETVSCATLLPPECCCI